MIWVWFSKNKAVYDRDLWSTRWNRGQQLQNEHNPTFCLEIKLQQSKVILSWGVVASLTKGFLKIYWWGMDLKYSKQESSPSLQTHSILWLIPMRKSESMLNYSHVKWLSCCVVQVRFGVLISYIDTHTRHHVYATT